MCVCTHAVIWYQRALIHTIKPAPEQTAHNEDGLVCALIHQWVNTLIQVKSLYWSLLINCLLLELCLIIHFVKVRRKVVNQGLSFVDANGDKANKMHPHVEDIMCFGCWYAVVLSREWANTEFCSNPNNTHLKQAADQCLQDHYMSLFLGWELKSAGQWLSKTKFDPSLS